MRYNDSISYQFYFFLTPFLRVKGRRYFPTLDASDGDDSEEYDASTDDLHRPKRLTKQQKRQHSSDGNIARNDDITNKPRHPHAAGFQFVAPKYDDDSIQRGQNPRQRRCEDRV